MILSEEEVKQMSIGVKHFIPANSVFIIVDGKRFDLDDIVDKAEWESIEYCNWIAKDRYQRDSNGDLIIDGGAKRYGVADLYVERPGEIAKAKVSKKQLQHRACDYIFTDSESERIKKCRVLGRNLKSAIPADVLDFLIEKAEKDPNKIINLYEGEDWKMQLFIMEAIDRGVISKSAGLYKYEDKVLAGSMEGVVEFLKDVKYSALKKAIQKETYPEFLPKADLTELINSSDQDLKSAMDLDSSKPVKNKK